MSTESATDVQVSSVLIIYARHEIRFVLIVEKQDIFGELVVQLNLVQVREIRLSHLFMKGSPIFRM